LSTFITTILVVITQFKASAFNVKKVQQATRQLYYSFTVLKILIRISQFNNETI